MSHSKILLTAIAALTLPLCAASALGSVTVTASDPSGLSAEAQFTITSPTTLTIRLRNTSTGVPSGFSNSDQLLTGVSWDFGAPGSNPGEPAITGGVVRVGPSSTTINFSTGTYGPNADISGEWGYGNAGSGLAFQNFISTLTAGSTAFPGANLDGPSNLNGPQGGLLSSTPLVSIGGLGVVRDEIIASVTLSSPITNLNFITSNLVRFEFGSDARFVTTPTPGAAALLAAAGLVASKRRRS
jgi:hypothetical protein